MASTTDRTSARNRARQALAEKQRLRRERDERMEAAATKYFAAADALEKAQREAGEAIGALIAEGESKSDIAELLGISTREIKAALNSATGTGDGGDDDEATGEESDEGDSGSVVSAGGVGQSSVYGA